MKILVIEDQFRLAELLKKGLTECHYTVRIANNCSQAETAISESSFDVIILDLSLPDGDGLEMLRRWRAAGFNEPVLILSARDTLADRVKGLDLGADDYLPKPFGLEEVVARIRSLIRRQSVVKQTVMVHNGIKLDLLARTVFVDNELIELTSREYALLEVYLQNHGRILPRTLIAEKIWGSNYDVDTNLLDVYMSRLRSKIENITHRPIFKTIRGVGYQLI